MKKNRAANDALITAGSAAIIKKYSAIGKPAKVPNPFTVPAVAPTKNLEILWFNFLFLYPRNNKKAKIRTVIEIIKWVIFGSSIDNKWTPKGVPIDTPTSK